MDDCLTIVSFLLFLFLRLITFPSRAFTVASRPLFLRPVYTPTQVRPQNRPDAPNSERKPYLPQISQQQNSSASGGPCKSFLEEESVNTRGKLKPGSHMSPMIGELLSVTIQGENSQRILLMSSHKQWSSPMSATYENQA